MTIEQFGLLNDTEKENAVWKDGILLVNYEEENKIVDVYKFFDFYVSFQYGLNVLEKAKITEDHFPNRLLGM